MINKKVALLVHAGWSIGNDGYDINFYNDKFKEFDKVIITFPKLDDDVRKVLFEIDIDKLIDYLYTGKSEYKKSLHQIYNIQYLVKPAIKLKQVINKKMPFVKVNINGVKGVYKRPTVRPRDIFKKIILKEFRSIKRDKIFDILFNGDYAHIPELNDVITEFRKPFENNDKFLLLDYGGLTLTKLLLKNNIVKDGILGEASDVYLFGEFYNQCVRSIGNMLDSIDVKYTKIPEYSTWNLGCKCEYCSEKNKHIDYINNTFFHIGNC